MYVDDLMMGKESTETVAAKRTQVVEVFKDATFDLNKWHSNVASLEVGNVPESTDNEQPSYIETKFGVNKSETKLLGLPWDKSKDTLYVKTSPNPVTTKREGLSELAKVYDPLGLVSPTTLVAKQLYREMCEAKVLWDMKLADHVRKPWNKWQRAMAPFFQPVTAVMLHAFDDASKLRVSAAVYAVVEQENGSTQGLVCAKSRLAKQNLTIPCLELVAAHMATNLAMNVERAISMVNVSSVHCWSDSTVALYWINGQSGYRQFVSNRVTKIRNHTYVQ